MTNLEACKAPAVVVGDELAETLETAILTVLTGELGAELELTIFIVAVLATATFVAFPLSFELEAAVVSLAFVMLLTITFEL